MSSKNLKVYKILFITEVKTLHLNVKFPCEIKMIWKRSNESAQTKRVKLINGKAQFNEKLKLHVNMYCDINTKKFVQKKCIYNFLIFTDKGEKSAGSVTYDLADFFNKRLYQVEQQFQLQKCPVKDTRVEMKIQYQQSVQSGYDSMSQISVTSQIDTSSSNPLDLSQLNESKDHISEKSSSTVQASRINDKVQIQLPQKEEDYGILNDSDVESDQFKSKKVITEKKLLYGGDAPKENKIGENIKGIEEVTHKLNDFALKFKQNLSYDIQEKKRKITKLTEDIQSAQQSNKKLQVQLSQQRASKDQLALQLSTVKTSLSSTQTQSTKKLQQLTRKLQQQKQTTQKLQKRLLDVSSKGQQQGKYIQQLKQTFKKEQTYLKDKNQQLSQELKLERSKRVQAEIKLKQVQSSYTELNQKYDRLMSKYETLEENIRNREEELEQARVNLDQAVQSLVDSLSSII